MHTTYQIMYAMNLTTQTKLTGNWDFFFKKKHEQNPAWVTVATQRFFLKNKNKKSILLFWFLLIQVGVCNFGKCNKMDANLHWKG